MKSYVPVHHVSITASPLQLLPFPVTFSMLTYFQRRLLRSSDIFNPLNGLLKNQDFASLNQPFMKKLDFIEVDYGRFSDYGYKSLKGYGISLTSVHYPICFMTHKPMKTVSFDSQERSDTESGKVDMVTSPGHN